MGKVQIHFDTEERKRYRKKYLFDHKDLKNVYCFKFSIKIRKKYNELQNLTFFITGKNKV